MFIGNNILSNTFRHFYFKGQFGLLTVAYNESHAMANSEITYICVFAPYANAAIRAYIRDTEGVAFIQNTISNDLCICMT